MLSLGLAEPDGAIVGVASLPEQAPLAPLTEVRTRTHRARTVWSIARDSSSPRAFRIMLSLLKSNVCVVSLGCGSSDGADLGVASSPERVPLAPLLTEVRACAQHRARTVEYRFQDHAELTQMCVWCLWVVTVADGADLGVASSTV